LNITHGHFGNFASLNKIVFVGNYYNFYVGFAVLFDFFEPRIQVDERLLFEEIKHKDNTFCPLIVGVRDSSVPLLASSVPNLKLNLALLQS
jgi:hypothetical protein